MAKTHIGGKKKLIHQERVTRYGVQLHRKFCSCLQDDSKSHSVLKHVGVWQIHRKKRVVKMADWLLLREIEKHHPEGDIKPMRRIT